MASAGGECGAKSGQPVDLSELDGDAVFQEFSPPPSFSLASQVTYTEHETGEVEHDTREVETTLQLPRLTPDFVSDWMSLPTDAAEHDTRWEVQFWCGAADGDAGVALRCASVQYPAAVRLLITVVDDPHNWMETADVLESDTAEKSLWMFARACFPQRRFEWSESARRRQQVRVRVRWTRVQLSPRAVTHLTSGLAQVRCIWRLAGFRTMRPTAVRWRLWSEPFGSGALWRMVVANCSSSRSSRRELQVGVVLQHVTEEVRHLQWSCTLGDKSSNNNKNMEKRSYCWWPVADDVERLSADTLEVQLLIRITRPQ